MTTCKYTRFNSYRQEVGKKLSAQKNSHKTTLLMSFPVSTNDVLLFLFVYVPSSNFQENITIFVGEIVLILGKQRMFEAATDNNIVQIGGEQWQHQNCRPLRPVNSINTGTITPGKIPMFG